MKLNEVPVSEKCANTEFFSGPSFPVFGLNTGKDGPEKTSYLDTFHAVYNFPRELLSLIF